jgi:hypothetical protein
MCSCATFVFPWVSTELMASSDVQAARRWAQPRFDIAQLLEKEKFWTFDRDALPSVGGGTDPTVAVGLVVDIAKLDHVFSHI